MSGIFSQPCGSRARERMSRVCHGLGRLDARIWRDCSRAPIESTDGRCYEVHYRALAEALCGRASYTHIASIVESLRHPRRCSLPPFPAHHATAADTRRIVPTSTRDTVSFRLTKTKIGEKH